MLVNLWLERRIMEGGADHMIANSELVKRQAMTYYNVPENRISVVYPGVDLKRFNDGIRQQWRTSVRRELGIADDETVLLFLANNFKRKGLHLVFRTLAKISKQNRKVRLLVVGGGRVPRYRLFARLMGIGDRVLFIGWTSAIEHYYSAADVFVLPTSYDPFAAVCLEAMACGLPVVTTRMNGASEMIVDGENGFVVGSPKLQDELTERIQRLLNVDRRAVMGALAKQQAAVFSFMDHFRHIESVLVRIATHRRAQQSQTVRPSPDLVINQAFLPLLRRHRLATYTCLMGAQEATQVKKIGGKQILLFSLQEQGKTLTLYLKRHHSRFSLLGRYRRWVNREIRTEGMAEWSNIHAFHARGLPTVTPVAAGERFLPDRGKESFVLTLGLSDYVPLDQYIRRQFVPPMTKARLKKKRALVRAVANLTREMHWAGFNHRDYYLCHLFVKEDSDAKLNLKMIDLQRVDSRRWFRHRWIVKDLAALYYSSLATPLTLWDRLRFFALYTSNWKDREARRTILLKVLRKSERICRHDARKLKKRKVSQFDKSELSLFG